MSTILVAALAVLFFGLWRDEAQKRKHAEMLAQYHEAASNFWWKESLLALAPRQQHVPPDSEEA